MNIKKIRICKQGHRAKSLVKYGLEEISDVLNSFWRRTKAPISQAIAFDQKGCTSDNVIKRMECFRLMWMDTRYEPGEVRVVAYNDQSI